MNRREFAFDGAATLAAIALTADVGAAEPEPVIGRAAASSSARDRADCNLAPPTWYDTAPPRWDPEQVTPEIVETVHRSGLTVMKLTLGGFNSPLEETLAEIAAVQRLIRRSKTSSTASTCFARSVCGDAALVQHACAVRRRGTFAAGLRTDRARSPGDCAHERHRCRTRSQSREFSYRPRSRCKASRKPVLMTHGGCTAVHQHPRNKTDADLRALAEKGGVFGIYDLFYLTPSPTQPTLDDYMAHMTHALDVCGEDHVGIGSDSQFDVLDVSPEARANWDKVLEARRASGMAAPEEDRMPFTEGLNRADRTLVIADSLLRRGYSARVAEKILGANFVRAFREIW